MKKEVCLLPILVLVLILAGCSESVGKAIQPFDFNNTSSEPISDDLTERFEREVLNKNPSLKTTTTTPAGTSVKITTTTVASAPSTGAIIVIMNEGKYTPSELKISIGETVRWVNDGTQRVYVLYTYANDEFRSSRIDPGEFFEHTFNEPGEYLYQDVVLLDKMRGKITVE